MPSTRIIVREKSAQHSAAVNSIMTVVTAELRSVYRPIKDRAQKETDKPLCIVASINNNVAGSAEYLIYENSILVRGLAVSPAYRRQGVARAMIEYVQLKAQQHGKAELVLHTIKETGNADIFLRLGFTTTAETISEKFTAVQGEQLTLITMKKTCLAP